VLESSTETCPHCGGTGHVRSVSSVALQLLRALDDTLMKGATHNLIARTRADVAIYVLNNKRAHLRGLEERFKVAITVTTDPTLTSIPAYAIDRGEQVMSVDQARAIAAQVAIQHDSALPHDEDEDIEVAADDTAEAEGRESEFGPAEGEGRGERADSRRRRRGRRGGRGRHRRDEGEFGREERAPGEAQPAGFASDDDQDAEAAIEETGEAEVAGAAPERTAPRDAESADDGQRRRRRGRRGGRRNGRREGPDEAASPAYERDGADDIAARPPQDEAPVRHRDEEMPVRAEAAPRVERPAEPAPPPADAAPRRRSTVREPAPVFDMTSDAPAYTPPSPAPAPSPAAPAAEAESDKPRRFGWWSKRG
jgi:ribonuclease E